MRNSTTIQMDPVYRDFLKYKILRDRNKGEKSTIESLIKEAIKQAYAKEFKDFMSMMKEDKANASRKSKKD